MEEIWKVIPDHPDYEVSTLGNFRRCTPGQGTRVGMPRTKYINPVTGYENVTLGKRNTKGVKARTYSVHKLVAMTFLPNPEGYRVVRHKNYVKTDNRVENLEWCQVAMNRAGKGIIATRQDTGEQYEFPTSTAFCKWLGLEWTNTVNVRIQQGLPYLDRATGITWNIVRVSGDPNSK